MKRREFLRAIGLGAAGLALPGCANRPRRSAHGQTACEPAIPPNSPDPHRKPNIIFILADDLGYGELGCYGQKKIRTPNLDRLAVEGMRFTQAYSGSPVCAPSRCTLLTGKHTGHAFIRNNSEMGGWGPGAKEGQLPLPKNTPTLARLLKQQGYATCAVGKWGLGGPESSGHPNRQGFDHWYGHLCQRVAHNYYPTHLWRNGERDLLEGNTYFKAHQRIKEPPDAPSDWDRFKGAQYAPDLMIDESLQFVRKHKDQPFFLYFATPVPHVALQVPEDSLAEYRGQWDEQPYLGQKGYLPHPTPRAAYAAMITRMDRDIGRLLNLLTELGLDENTLIVFSSDNGPTFNGGTDSKFFESADPLRGLKCDLWEGGIRVPLIARWKGRIAPGTTSEHVCAFWDVLPTVAAAAGAAPPADTDGISFLPTLLSHGEQRQHEHLYWEYSSGGGWQAVRLGRWKGLRRGLKKDANVPIELYDLETDISETIDVAAQHPDIVARIAEIMRSERTESRDFPLR